jgi:hypothetical protein
VLAVLMLGAAGAGCAMSERADLEPSVDPNLPSVDASYGSAPAPGRRSEPEPEDSGAGSNNSGEDSGGKITGPDASVDAGPPPPPKPSAGEVVISEVMYDTFGTEPASEWIELHNKASGVRALSGLTIKDGGGRVHVIGPGLTIAPGAYVVLARTKSGAIAAKVPASVIVYEYGTGLPDNGGVLLANGTTGGVSLLSGSVAIADAPYGGWFSQSGGSSVQLHAMAGVTSSKASWCLSLYVWAAGSDKGTPGAAEDCP